LNRKRSGTPVVQRRHEVDEQACVSALKLLLKSAARRGNDGGDDDDGKEIEEHVPARESIRGGQHRHHGR
jgi:hypothetical protein